MWKSLKQIGRKARGRNGRGATLIEVVIAIVVLGLMVASIPPAMATVANSEFRQNELNIARDVTQAQFEYIKAQVYNPANPDNTWSSFPPYAQVPLPSGYTMQVWYDLIDPSTGNVTLKQTNGDEGIQRVTIFVFGWSLQESTGKPTGDIKYILKTTDYKVDRSLQINWYGVSG
jgi:type II secretory pathway pseudopilin PulG